MVRADKTIDAQGLACPMPIVKTKQGMEAVAPGEVVEVLATDRGSLADVKAWAEATGHHYLGTIETGEVLKHYVRKASRQEVKQEAKYDEVIDVKTLQSKLDEEEEICLVDVREEAEYAFGHIFGAINIPLGELGSRFDELDRSKEILVICRSGNRSDLACRQLKEAGFEKVKNVVPGMSSWEGDVINNQ